MLEQRRQWMRLRTNERDSIRAFLRRRPTIRFLSLRRPTGVLFRLSSTRVLSLDCSAILLSLYHRLHETGKPV